MTLWQRGKTYIMTNKNGMPRFMKGKHLYSRLHAFVDSEVGIYWEDGPPTEVADLIDNSMPVLYRKMLHKRVAADIAEADK